jgi:nucleoside-diphosphate-sugar epimerase
MRRAIICGYGQLGQAIAKELKQKNIQVYGICRSNKSDPYATIIASDIFEITSLPYADYLYYLIPPESKRVHHQKKSYIHGLKHILSVLSKHKKPPKVILKSSINIYQDTDIHVVNEQTPLTYRSELTKLLATSENILRQSRYQHLILRTAPLKEALLAKLTSQMLKGQLSYAKCANPIHWVPLQEAARLYTTLINEEGIFNISTYSANFNTTVAWLSTKLGVRLSQPKHPQPYQSRPTIYTTKYASLRSRQLVTP